MGALVASLQVALFLLPTTLKTTLCRFVPDSGPAILKAQHALHAVFGQGPKGWQPCWL